MRLAKYLARAGVASRRHAERLITSGRVAVDGEIVIDPARDVSEANEVTVEGRDVRVEQIEHHALNKPVGVVSTAHDPQGRPKVTDLVPSDVRLYPVGRLDADSSGLIVLTNDGDLANKLMHPRHQVEKVYRARVSGTPSATQLDQLRGGVELEDGLTAPARVEVVEPDGTGPVVLELAIREGRKRQVRRMCDAIGHRAVSLERVRIGPLELGDLAPGESRPLTPAEVKALRDSVCGG